MTDPYMSLIQDKHVHADRGVPSCRCAGSWVPRTSSWRAAVSERCPTPPAPAPPAMCIVCHASIRHAETRLLIPSFEVRRVRATYLRAAHGEVHELLHHTAAHKLVDANLACTVGETPSHTPILNINSLRDLTRAEPKMRWLADLYVVGRGRT